MIVTKEISFIKLMQWSGHHIVWLTAFVGLVVLLYQNEILTTHIPWLPVSVIGTAVAFYVGFKNNQSYDRLWEARKIWGGIVNDSRTWGMLIDGYISNLHAPTDQPEDALQRIKKRLIYRHIAWLYAHRSQLLVSTSWEHSRQGGMTGRMAKEHIKRFGIGMVDDEVTKSGLQSFLAPDEYHRLVGAVNTATQIINEQSRDLRDLRAEGLIDDFRHVQLTDVLRSFYTLQGRNERIKKFPLPRQYANMSRYFVGIFVFLLPFSMVPALMDSSEWGIWLSIPITVVVGWVYIMMEVIGDYSENPFQGMINDIPMLSLCRVIEIDLKEMLGETELPQAIEESNGVLM